MKKTYKNIVAVSIVLLFFLILDVESKQRELRNIYSLQTDRFHELDRRVDLLDKTVDKIHTRIYEIESINPVSRSAFDSLTSYYYTTSMEIFALKQSVEKLERPYAKKKER